MLTFVFSAVEGERTRIAEREKEKAEDKAERARKKAKSEAEAKREKARAEAEIKANPYACPHCGKRFATPQALAGHLGGVARGKYDAETERQSIPATTRQEVIDRDSWQCYHCGKDLRGAGPGEIHVDHFIPRHWGGPNSLLNLVTSCAHCNISKGANMPSLSELCELQIHLVKQQPLPMKSKVWLLFHSGIVSKQKDIASALEISPSYVSSLLSEPVDEPSEELCSLNEQLGELVKFYTEEHDVEHQPEKNVETPSLLPDEQAALVIEADCPVKEKVWMLSLLNIEQEVIANLLDVTLDYVTDSLKEMPEDLSLEN